MSDQQPQRQMTPFFPALVFIGIFIVLLFLLMPEPQVNTRVSPTSTQPPTVVALVPTELPTEIPPAQPPAQEVADFDPALVAAGQGVFQSTCSACHGYDAHGIPGLGKDLILSEFVHGLTDDQLLQFIAAGRDTSDPLNTTGIAMPPRGGNPSITDDQLRSVIAYLRSESGSVPAQTVAPTTVPVATQVAPTAAPVETQVVEAATAEPQPAILPTSIPVTPQSFSAQTAYAWSCAACHGSDGTGNPPFAEGFVTSPLLTDRAALLELILSAHPPISPQVQFSHPARGGYPALTDEQLNALLDYVVTLRTP